MEYDRVLAMTAAEVSENAMVIKSLSNDCNIQNFSLSIEENTCVGILGTFYSGNSELLKLICGQSKITDGEVFIKNQVMSINKKVLQKKIGYCPPSDAFFKYLTGRQNLEFFGLMKGIPRQTVHRDLRSIADDIKLTEYLDKYVNEYSVGTRRKLSAAIALLGNPQIILLDSVMSELDFISKKKLMNHVNKLKFEGRAILLAEKDLKDCEIVCSKIAIMHDGKLKHLGSPANLKHKFSKGVDINVKLKHQECIERSVLIVSIKDYIERSFPKINS